jgi:hypothetical protein
MVKFFKISSFIFLIHFHFSLLAQESEQRLVHLLDFEFVENLPENILVSKSVVIVDIPEDDNEDWREICSEFQKGFHKSGIDAFSYYHVNDLFASPECSKAFIDDIKTRLAKNVIFLSKDPNTNQYQIIITAFNNETSLVNQGQKAWKNADSNIKEITKRIISLTVKAELKKSNFLIIETPEIFSDTKLLKGRRFEAYNIDLKLDKLAVPRFEEKPLPKENIDPVVQQNIMDYNEKIRLANQELDTLMKQIYPYKFELVDMSKGEDFLKKAGFHYILLFVHTKPENIKLLLNYTATQLDKKPLRAKSSPPQYKFYIKHILTGDVYLGSVWDPAPSWQQSLMNYFTNMKRELKIED